MESAFRPIKVSLVVLSHGEELKSPTKEPPCNCDQTTSNPSTKPIEDRILGEVHSRIDVVRSQAHNVLQQQAQVASALASQAGQTTPELATVTSKLAQQLEQMDGYMKKLGEVQKTQAGLEERVKELAQSIK